MTAAQPAGLPPREADSAAASAVKAMQAEGRHAEARERYAELVARHQRRAARIAFHYLRDGAESDEAVQDAFVKAYSHLSTFREELPFEVWFTRILINGCLDRIKARTRRERWMVSMPDHGPGERDFAERTAGHGPSPEDLVLARERRQKLAAALARLPDRQRSVFMLSHYEGCTSREVSAITGLNESTVRVHLFRAIRKLRGMLTEGRMGLLNPHLDDDDCADVWSARLTLGTAESDRPAESAPPDAAASAAPATAPSPAGSTPCATDAHAEADEVFTRDRLATQQAQIFRRLESLEHPARIIAFPRFARPVSVQPAGRRRWIAAAAAVGLITGVGLGQLLDFSRQRAGPAIRRTAGRDAADRAAPASSRSPGERRSFLYEPESRLAGARAGLASVPERDHAGRRDYDPR